MSLRSGAILISAGVAIAASGLLLAPARSSAPWLEVSSSESLVRADVEPNSDLQWRIPLSTQHPGLLNLSVVAKSCSCFHASVEPVALRRGEAAELTIKTIAPDWGSRSGQVLVRSESGGVTQDQLIEFSATVRRQYGLRVAPSSVSVSGGGGPPKDLLIDLLLRESTPSLLREPSLSATATDGSGADIPVTHREEPWRRIGDDAVTTSATISLPTLPTVSRYPVLVRLVVAGRECGLEVRRDSP